ncbi:hypothetical protein DFJ73DRAFT_645529 [Zopfochytrium polystomum]|nr:hypothetical protein DFJ73DRAFT_645529 [Zopfochytrium polystomum]
MTSLKITSIQGQDVPKPSADPRSIVVFSGGSAANNFVTMLQAFTDNICYILPVSDDGGSTSEIVKIVGGPGIGDIRSRLVRLAETKTMEVHKLLAYRLPIDSAQSVNGTTPAKIEWLDIVEGRHVLWRNISQPYKESIRAFLLQFHLSILKQAGPASSFDFRGGSLGNFFLTGCRLFFNSLEAAIFQFARITRSPPRTEVLPIISTNQSSVAIAASLRNGSVIFGQCEISHPGVLKRSLNSACNTIHDSPVPSPLAASVASSRASSSSNLIFSKSESIPPLPSCIRRIYYTNPEKAETFAALNSLVSWHLVRKRTVLYMMGSLYTSIIPCLIVPGVGRLLMDDPGGLNKVLLLNGTHDRETAGYTALDFILAITDALNYSCLAEDFGVAAMRHISTREVSQDMDGAVHVTLEERGVVEKANGTSPKEAARVGRAGGMEGEASPGPSDDEMESSQGRGYLVRPFPPQAFITHLLYPEEGDIEVEKDIIEAMGIRCLQVPANSSKGSAPGHYEVDELKSVLEPLIQ